MSILLGRMSPGRKPHLPFIALALLASLMLALALAANPGWHEHAHHHHAEAQTVCVVELFAHGHVDSSACPASAVPPRSRVTSELRMRSTGALLPAFFLSAAILEHAPPGRV